MNSLILLAMARELVKLADHPTADAALEKASPDLETLRSRLKPGDIILSTPHLEKISPFMRQVFKPASKLFQGTTFGHAALYAGDGKILDTRDRGWKAVHETTLEKFTKDHDLIVMDPNTTESSREAAIRYLRDNIGKKRFSQRKLLQTITPFTGEREPGAKPEEPPDDAVVCSTMVANAYPRKVFSERSRVYTRPGDILKAPNMTPVTAFIGSGKDYRSRKP